TAGAGALVLGSLLTLTNVTSLSAGVIVVGGAATVSVLIGFERIHLLRPGRVGGVGLDVIAVALLLLAVPDIVVYTSSRVIPTSYFPPGIIQFQQDWILGPANQLLGGGALLVNVPSSQYGVGLVY